MIDLTDEEAFDEAVAAAVLAGSDRAVKRAVAASLRTQATALRTIGDTMIGTAREYDRWADGIERDKAPVPVDGVRYRLIAEDVTPREEAEGDADEEPEGPAPLQRIKRQVVPAPPGYIYVQEDGAALSEAMHAWLDSFDPRTLGLEEFPAAVNEAFGFHGCTEDAARQVHGRAQQAAELRERSSRDG